MANYSGSSRAFSRPQAFAKNALFLAALIMGNTLQAQTSTNAPVSTNSVQKLPEVLITGARESAGDPKDYSVTESRTATKTETPLRDVPQSIQAVPHRVIKDQQAIVLDDALRNVSGVQKNNSFGGTQDGYAIRGFSSQLLIDGFTASGTGLNGLSNVERVEVLKGPNSVLYGLDGSGGAINLVTKKPLDAPYYAAEFQAGSFNFFRFQADATGPVTKDGKVLFRLNGVVENSDVSYEPDGVDLEKSKRYEIHPSITLRPWEDTEILLQFSYAQINRPMRRGLVAVGTGVADIPYDTYLGELGDRVFVEKFNLRAVLDHNFNDSLKLRQSFNGFWQESDDIRAEPSGNVNTATGVLNRLFSINNDENQVLSSQTDFAAEFDTGQIAHNALVGVSLSRQEGGGINGNNPTFIPINIYNPVYGTPVLPITTYLRNNHAVVDDVGVYVQDQVTLLENLKILGGIGYNTSRSRGINHLTGVSFESEFSGNFSPRAGLVYQPVQAVSLYFNYSQSVFAVTPVAITGGGPTKPLTETLYEGGVKTEFYDGKLTSTLAVFNLARANVIAADPANPGFSVQIGEVTSKGVEFDVAGNILPGWDVIGSYAFTDATITEDTVAANIGRQFTSVPEHAASLWSVYRIQSGPVEGLGFGAGIYYVGERMGDTANTYSVPSYVRTDATVFYEQKHWRAAINVKNLFDKEYIASASGSRTRIDPGEPLTVIGSISVNF